MDIHFVIIIQSENFTEAFMWHLPPLISSLITTQSPLFAAFNNRPVMSIDMVFRVRVTPTVALRNTITGCIFQGTPRRTPITRF